jgi:hypothetical protein
MFSLFTRSPTIQIITLTAFCVASTDAQPTAHGCLDPSVIGLPFCNVSLSYAERVADLISRMNLTEKTGLMGSYVPGGDM